MVLTRTLTSTAVSVSMRASKRRTLDACFFTPTWGKRVAIDNHGYISSTETGQSDVGEPTSSSPVRRARMYWRQLRWPKPDANFNVIRVSVPLEDHAASAAADLWKCLPRSKQRVVNRKRVWEGWGWRRGSWMKIREWREWQYCVVFFGKCEGLCLRQTRKMMWTESLFAVNMRKSGGQNEILRFSSVMRRKKKVKRFKEMPFQSHRYVPWIMSRFCPICIAILSESSR